ncbi:MAG: hypothetical protein C0467_20945 [Planctomycetaceae bacterium]|nr:hypothetical protein [Planctomycetaceae bacterium]
MRGVEERDNRCHTAAPLSGGIPNGKRRDGVRIRLALVTLGRGCLQGFCHQGGPDQQWQGNKARNEQADEYRDNAEMSPRGLATCDDSKLSQHTPIIDTLCLIG